MTGAQHLTDAELLAELQRRGRTPKCQCQGWRTYWGAWDRHGATWRCRGCLRIPAECNCR